MSILKTIPAALLGVSLLSTSALGADRETSRNVIAEKGDAVVTLEIVLSVKFSGYGQQMDSERKMEAVGTVLDENGMVVTALSALDPGSFYTRQTGEEDQYVTRLKSLKYILPGNEEVEAGVVLRDGDLDIVILKPLEKPEDVTFTYIPLEESPDLDILDEIIVIGRMGRIARRTVAGMTGEIQAIVEKPRKMYITDGEITSAGVGSPVLTPDGKLVGINTYYSFPGGAKALGGTDEPYIPIVIDTSSIIPVAEQAADLEPMSVEEIEPDEPAAPADEATEEESEETTE